MLRPYQVSAIGAVMAELARGIRSTMLVQATGCGKTVQMAELARLEVSRSGRVLIVVHRDELIRQTKKKLEAVGLWPDVEKGTSRANTFAKVVIASVQTLRGARLARWARQHFTLVLVDECHHSTATGYRNVLDHFCDAKVVGVTATSDRADGVGLGEIYASVAYRYEIRQAITEEWLVPIVARRVVVDSVDLSDVAIRAGDFAQDQLAAMMGEERTLRGTAVPLLELAAHRPTIAFCVDVAHAEKLAATLNSMRPGCARSVSGKTPEGERERMLEGFARGEFQFITNCDVLTEGFDAPNCACVAMCRPTKSRARYVQGAGRGLRLLGLSYRESVANGKRDCLLLQFTDATSRLIGPADCLVGAGDIADDLRDEIDRNIASAQLDIAAVIEQAQSEIGQRRAAIRIAAVVKYHAENIDPFIGEALPDAAPPCDPAWEQQPPSAKQLEVLEEHAVKTDKLPAGFTRADAWRLLARVMSRRRDGLCSYKMAKRLTSLGIVGAAQLSATRAGELRDLCLQRGWHPSTLASQPEARARREEERGVA